MLLRRIAVVVCGLAVCFYASPAQAQHHGNRSNAAGDPSTPPVNGDIQQFDLAVALQASPEQGKQFNDWASDADAARRQAQAMTQVQEQVTAANILDFTDSLDDLQTDHDRFFGGFTAPQKSGLKEFVRKATKLNAEIARENKNLKAAGSDLQKAAACAGKLDSFLTELQSQQSELAGQMGIQRDSSSLH